MNGTEEQPPFPGLKVEGIGEVSLPLLRQERAEEIIQLIKATSSEQRAVERFPFFALLLIRIFWSALNHFSLKCKVKRGSNSKMIST